MDKTPELTPSEANAIIAACKKAGVQKLSFRGLTVEFGHGNAPEIPSPRPKRLRPGQASPEDISEDEKLREAEAKLARDAQELLLTDPEAYEDMLVKRELTEDGHSDDDIAEI